MLYRTAIRPILFRCDPEWAHDQAIAWSETAQRLPGLVRLSARLNRVVDSRLKTDVAGMTFDNPIGLAAGYDKSGRAIETMASLGFGHVEIGSISAIPSAGNPKPRLWRLPSDQATCVHYGLPNEGAEAIAKRLSSTRRRVPLGINLVNTNFGYGATPTPADDILDDYAQSAATLKDFASYMMLNLSCPNTADGRNLFDHSDHLARLLEKFQTISINAPVFLKISPDVDDAAIDRLLTSVERFKFVRGFMFNLSSKRREGLTTPTEVWKEWPGAISGRPTKEWMDDCIVRLYRRMDRNRYSIIAAGGVSDAQDAYKKIRCGASLVQLLTALIYEGPGVARRINRGLVKLLERDGFANLSDVVGIDITD